jgi:hypothetical protein
MSQSGLSAEMQRKVPSSQPSGGSVVTLQSRGSPVVPSVVVGVSVVPLVGMSWVVPLSVVVCELLVVVPLLLLVPGLVSSQQVRSLRSSGLHQS